MRTSPACLPRRRNPCVVAAEPEYARDSRRAYVRPRKAGLPLELLVVACGFLESFTRRPIIKIGERTWG